MRNPEPIEPIVYLLSVLLLVLAGLIIFCEYFFPMDGQIFTVFTGAFGSIVGAFLMRIKPRGNAPEDSGQDVTTISQPKNKPGSVKVEIPPVEEHK